MFEPIRSVRLAPRATGCLLAWLCVAALLAVPAPARAAAPVAPAAPGGPGKLMLVLDSSGSMAEPASGGGTKIAAAKSALGTVIDQLPDDAPVGLRVYGSKVFKRTDPGACTDSERVVDIGTGNRKALEDAVGRYQPYGETPIGYALQEADKDLGTDGKRSIVLVSDGEPTCPPDPCEVARQLAGQGVDLRIDVVGLDVSGKAENALRCIAKAGRGTYYDVRSAKDLVDALATLATRAVRPYEPSGQPVTGGTSAADAPTIGAGSYTDQLGGPGTATGVRTYAVERAQPGSSLTVSASIRTPAFASDQAASDAWDGLQVELTGTDGSPCQTAAPGTMRSMDTPFVVATATDEDCADADRLDVTVTRDSGGQAFTTPLELVVTEELPVADVASLPPAVPQPTWVAPPTGRPTAGATGGTSFATATPLAPGVYRGTLVPNEIQVFSVDVGWGQQLSASMTIAKPTGRLVGELSEQGSHFKLDLFGPTRADARAPADGSPPEAWDLYPTAGGTSGGTTTTVAYRNREDVSDPVRAAARAGSFPVAVSLIDDRAKASYEVPFVLRVGVSGPVSGAPTFLSPSPSPSASPADGPTSSADAEPSATPDGGSGASAADDTDEGGVSPALVGAGGVVLLGALVGVLVMLRRRAAQPK